MGAGLGRPTRRPWLGAEEPEQERAGDRPTTPTATSARATRGPTATSNPDYAETFVFTNDFAALRPDTSTAEFDDGLLRAEGERGICRVVCFSPRHDLTLGRMAPAAVRRVIDVWADQTAELGANYRWVQVFENRGEAMGASNPHPHGQIWAGTALPGDGAREDASQRAHLASTGQRLLLDYVDQESGGQRVIVENDEWLAVVPFWAAWPFETLLIPQASGRAPDRSRRCRPRRSGGRRCTSSSADTTGCSSGRSRTRWAGTRRPSATTRPTHWQVHAHFYPPLLRANMRKFMVGYELLAETQRDLTAEDAAGRLRAVAARRVTGGRPYRDRPARARRWRHGRVGPVAAVRRR